GRGQGKVRGRRTKENAARRAGPRGESERFVRVQQGPPPRTRKKLSMSASVPMSPSWLKSAELVQGGWGQVPAMHRKKASMSASVPTSPSQLKSGESQPPPGGATVMTTVSVPLKLLLSMTVRVMVWTPTARVTRAVGEEDWARSVAPSFQR